MRRRRRRRREATTFSLSFLDAISCGFGAVVMLLVLSKIGEPRAMEQSVSNLQARIARLQEEIFELRGQTTVIHRKMVTVTEQLSEEKAAIARLQGDLSRIQGEHKSSRQLSEVQDILEGRLLAAQQELTEEMKRLLGRTHKRPVDDATVGGVPVDSEYIIFIIDTSGSMHSNAWPMVQRKMQETLNIYPKVKGLQIMNDMGQYMFSRYAGKWIPDTPGRRKIILDRLRSWNVFSNSSPVEGIERAVRTYGSPSKSAPDKKVSIYVFGDEFSGGSVEEVLRAVAKVNTKDQDGNPRVRIHAVGFPVIFQVSGVSEGTGVRFATLMRALCRENGGTFVGLSSIVP
jgi:hypothetical protein